jgi:hypothetical protein
VLEALVVAVIYCLIVMLVAWLLVTLVAMVPVPSPIGAILPTLIWAIAAIACLIILLRVLFGAAPALP